MRDQALTQKGTGPMLQTFLVRQAQWLQLWFLSPLGLGAPGWYRQFPHKLSLWGHFKFLLYMLYKAKVFKHVVPFFLFN